MYVFDATPLIYLATVDRLAVVDALPADCSLPESVHSEVVTAGIDAGHADARRIERAIDADRLEVADDPETALFDRLSGNEHLSEADAAVIALADDIDGTAVMDEQYGRTVADTESVPTRGTAFLVLNALKRGSVDADDARQALDDMLEAGWYCSPDLYAQLRAKIDDLAD